MSVAPSERIDTGKTWPVCTVQLRCYALSGVVHAYGIYQSPGSKRTHVRGAPSERIDTSKTWSVYTVRLGALGRRACI